MVAEVEEVQAEYAGDKVLGLDGLPYQFYSNIHCSDTCWPVSIQTGHRMGGCPTL